ncbi:hypothetical protein PAPYR_11383 [Paratrimastix pyriformis]|uniref:Uncharacterized protein n=1 Tax=Paratrimastix pyriformis TaxID=342808 RepID=A0ABQ8UB36_9EUKA|nr:hypothetical protein PAPYR_11383 [Paratrimastix pyriformis]
MWSKWEVPEWKRECVWEARKFSKPLQIHLEFSMFMRYSNLADACRLKKFAGGSDHQIRLFVPKDQTFSWSQTTLIALHFFYSCGFFSTLAVFLGVASDIILNDPGFLALPRGPLAPRGCSCRSACPLVAPRPVVPSRQQLRHDACEIKRNDDPFLRFLNRDISEKHLRYTDLDSDFKVLTQKMLPELAKFAWLCRGMLDNRTSISSESPPSPKSLSGSKKDGLPTLEVTTVHPLRSRPPSGTLVAKPPASSRTPAPASAKGVSPEAKSIAPAVGAPAPAVPVVVPPFPNPLILSCPLCSICMRVDFLASFQSLFLHSPCSIPVLEPAGLFLPTEASGSNRIMIALTLLLHALDETLAERLVGIELSTSGAQTQRTTTTPQPGLKIIQSKEWKYQNGLDGGVVVRIPQANALVTPAWEALPLHQEPPAAILPFVVFEDFVNAVFAFPPDDGGVRGRVVGVKEERGHGVQVDFPFGVVGEVLEEEFRVGQNLQHQQRTYCPASYVGVRERSEAL